MNDVPAIVKHGYETGALVAGAPQPVSILNIIADAASNPNTNVANLQALLQMQKEVLADEAKVAFNRDYFEMCKEMPRIKKDGSVGYKDKGTGETKEAFRFATIENIHDIIDPILEKYGFSIMFDSAPRAGDGGGITATVTLMHRSGHEKTSSFSAGLDASGGKSNVQGMHSSYSLAKRVALCAILNLVHEGKDDGGVAAGIRYITDEQKQELVELMKETKADTVRFLRHYAIDSLDEMQTKAFLGAKNTLLQKKVTAK